MLEMVMVVLIVALLSVAAVGIMKPSQPEDDVEKFASELMSYAVSARREAIRSRKIITITFDFSERSFNREQTRLQLPDNIMIMLNGQEVDWSSVSDTSEKLFILYPDGTVNIVADLKLYDQYQQVEISSSILVSGFNCSTRGKIRHEQETEETSSEVVPLWLDEDRV